MADAGGTSALPRSREGDYEDQKERSEEEETRITESSDEEQSYKRSKPRAARKRRKDYDSEGSEYEEERRSGRRTAAPVVLKSRFRMWWWWAGLLAVAFVWFLVAWPYVIFIYQIAIPMWQQNIFLGIFAFVLSHTVLALLMTSYMRTVISDPGYVPKMLLEQRQRDGEDVNICVKCNDAKPERAHHCSLCRRCVLKMDHHCPWVNNCVGYRNYKFFVLFLTYIPVTEGLLLAFTIPHLAFNVKLSNFFLFWNLQVILVSIMALLFGLGMFGFAFMHYRLILSNQTTLESFAEYTVKRVRMPSGRRKLVRERVPNIYDLNSWQSNFEQVFGSNPWLWFLPVHTEPGDGCSFPHNVDAVQDAAETGQSQRARRRQSGLGSSDEEEDGLQGRNDRAGLLA